MNFQDENTPLKGGGGGIVGSDTDGATCDVDRAAHRRFFAESGFVFLLSANTVDVIEPTSGFLVLTISFPGYIENGELWGTAGLRMALGLQFTLLLAKT
ncbi:hypothetical protein Pelo_18311 [Pelomyxa schiedti]|nr:hypothetical protein Pelo_18311 [Pelomyxa schiedti]